MAKKITISSSEKGGGSNSIAFRNMGVKSKFWATPTAIFRCDNILRLTQWSQSVSHRVEIEPKLFLKRFIQFILAIPQISLRQLSGIFAQYLCCAIIVQYLHDIGKIFVQYLTNIYVNLKRYMKENLFIKKWSSFQGYSIVIYSLS